MKEEEKAERKMKRGSGHACVLLYEKREEEVLYIELCRSTEWYRERDSSNGKGNGCRHRRVWPPTRSIYSKEISGMSIKPEEDYRHSTKRALCVSNWSFSHERENKSLLKSSRVEIIQFFLRKFL